MEDPSRWTESLAVFERPWVIYLHTAKSSDATSFKMIQPTLNRIDLTAPPIRRRQQENWKLAGKTEHTAELCTY